MEKYAELSTLNEGSYGVVQLVKQLKTSRMYAAKRISLKLSSFDEVNYEIQVHSKASKFSRVVQLVDHFLDPKHDEYVLILEYCSGGDLHDSIARGNRPSHEAVCRIMLQLLETLEFCHSRSIFHRDIKPENIFLQHNGNIKLGDWGLAITTKESSDFGTGSEQYMAPECFDRSAQFYNAAQADIWALGIVFVNLLFGRNPFKQATERDPLFADFAVSRETLYDIFPTLTKDVFQVLRHCLTLNPDHRSISAMKGALSQVRNWTTDDEIQHLQQRIDHEKQAALDAELRSQVVSSQTAAKIIPVVHKPFRVPTAVARSLKSPSTAWDRRKMYTPPISGAIWPRPGSYAKSLLPRHLEEPEEYEEDDVLLADSTPSSPSSSTSSAEISVSKAPAYNDGDMFTMDEDETHHHHHHHHRHHHHHHDQQHHEQHISQDHIHLELKDENQHGSSALHSWKKHEPSSVFGRPPMANSPCGCYHRSQ